jgi:hypothetical protein
MREDAPKARALVVKAPVRCSGTHVEEQFAEESVRSLPVHLLPHDLLLPEVDGFALFPHVKRIVAHSVRIRYGYPRCSDGGRGQA